MRVAPTVKSSEKRKRLSEANPTAPHDAGLRRYELYNHSHNRSESIGERRGRSRLYTDYQEREASKSREKQPGSTYYSKKRHQTQSLNNKMSAGEAIGSTKSNQYKNLELKYLFTKSKPAQLSKPKKPTNNHPLYKFVNKNKNVGVASPYTSQIERFEFLYAKLKKQKSKSKRSSSRQTNNDKNNSKAFRFSIDKKEINLNLKKPVLAIPNKDEDQQKTVKIIKKPRLAQQQPATNSEALSERSEEEGYGLTQEQEETFGNRFPYGFEKMKLLGRGGFSLVWLGRHARSGRQFAIKQIITQNTHQTHLKQIWFGTHFFTLGGVPKPEFTQQQGVKNLARMYSYEINQSDTWIFYEKCGQSLGSSLYDIRSENVYGDDRLYKIYYKPFYEALAANQHLLHQLVIQICKPLSLLSTAQIVHSDLKTENILLKFQPTSGSPFGLAQVKLIDYGSSFEFSNISQFSMATPEYMPPQILNYIIHENEGQYEEQLYEEVMTNYKKPWAVDIFSLGCVLLEIVVGVPLWMSLPLLVPNKTGGSYSQKTGLFAVKGRLFPEIIQKQRLVIARLDQVLSQQNYSKISLSPSMRNIIKGMLCIDFNKRISPAAVLEILQKQVNS